VNHSRRVQQTAVTFRSNNVFSNVLLLVLSLKHEK
jgi:hypothetical protein